jgi:hypothetical protein
VHVPYGCSPLPVRPSGDQCIVLLLGSFDEVGNDGPGGRVLKPTLTPFVITGPVGRSALAPKRIGAVVKHDRLTDFVAVRDVLRLREADTEAATREFEQSSAGCDRGAVIMDHAD